MFWQNFVLFCTMKDKSPNGVCADLGLSTAIATRWKNGSVPRDTTLKKIADYFGVTPEDLLRDPNDQATAPAEPPQPTDPLTDEFLELIDQLTLKELREVKAFMIEKINSRKGR